MRNLLQLFVLCTASQIFGGDFAKFVAFSEHENFIIMHYDCDIILSVKLLALIIMLLNSSKLLEDKNSHYVQTRFIKMYHCDEILYGMFGNVLESFQSSFYLASLSKLLLSGSFLQRQLMIANYRVKKFVRKSQQS